LARTVIVVLAAGGSRRLGQPKQLVTISGEPLIRRVVRSAVGSGTDQVVVVLGSSAYDCVGAIKECGVDIVINPFWESGLAGSLRIGVERAEAAGAEAVLILLADQPCLTPKVVQEFLDRAVARPDQVIAARYGDVLGPPIFFGSDWFPRLKALEGDQGARKLIREQQGRLDIVEWPEGAIDIDMPEDLSRALISLGDLT
jgi:CTP:molybdopterin cytidylyltransferase MocA